MVIDLTMGPDTEVPEVVTEGNSTDMNNASGSSRLLKPGDDKVD